MKRLVPLFLAGATLLSLLSGCQTPPEGTETDAAETTTAAETTEAPEDTVPAGTIIEPNGDFDLVYGDPVVLTQGAVGDQAWGHYQFPAIRRNLDGNIIASWSYSGDNIRYESAPDSVVTKKISEDEGQTWRLPTDERELVKAENLMPNGRYFQGFITKGAHTVDWLDDFEPATTWGDYKMFFREDLPINEDTVVLATEYDPETGKTHTFYVTVNWPNAPVVLYPGKQVYPFQQIFALSNRTIKTIDGVMYITLYFYGFDSKALTKEEAVHPYSHKYSVYILKSEDSGRTWDFVSQVLTTDAAKGLAEGLCEPEMTIMPDGSQLMLMRTGGGNPSYMVRSSTDMQSWTSVIRFDDIGVLPQLCTLDCGVTVATYGRPYMRVRATSDPKGIRWQDAETFKLTGGNGTSCYYTDLLPLDEDTALWIYSDFQYPNEKGEGVKTVITRTITVVPK